MEAGRRHIFPIGDAHKVTLRAPGFAYWREEGRPLLGVVDELQPGLFDRWAHESMCGKRERCTLCDNQMHVYEFGSTDWVVAIDVADAWLVWLEHVGGERDDYADDEDPDLVPDDKRVGFWIDEDGEIGEVNDGAVVYKMAGEWAQREGRGFLASSEY